jgi:tagaturonate reductase
MADPACRAALIDLYTQEIVPIFAAAGMGPRADAYVVEVVDRFANPFLAHRFADIATNHAAKVARRAGGLADFAAEVGHPGLGPRLRALMGSVG